METERISIESKRKAYNITYDDFGNAVMPGPTRNVSVTYWPFEAKDGYVEFGDKYLGASVTHRVAIKPGETCQEFYTRMYKARENGYVEVMGSSAYSQKHARILEKELGITPTVQIMDEGALVGSSYVEDGKTVYPHGKAVNVKDKMKHLPLLVVAVCMAIGYLIFAASKRGS